jgi:hypothetical protein
MFEVLCRLTAYYLRHYWDPADIVSALTEVATSDRNKPYLSYVVPLLTKALEIRQQNQRLISFSVAALSQLFFEPKCSFQFDSCSERLITCLGDILYSGLGDYNLAKDIRFLKSSVEESRHRRTVPPLKRDNYSENTSSNFVLIRSIPPADEFVHELEVLLQAIGFNVKCETIDKLDVDDIEDATFIVALITNSRASVDPW